MLDNETLKNIKQRRSIRSFKDEQIGEEELQAILEAGLYAPNAGDQAWHFTAIQNKELLGRLELAAKETTKQIGIPHLRELGNDENFNCLNGYKPYFSVVLGYKNVADINVPDRKTDLITYIR